MAESGSVAWQFERRGVISLDKSVIDEEDLSLTAIDAGALDIEDAGSMIDVITEPTDLIDIKDELEDKGFSIANADSLQVAKQRVALSDSDGRTVLRLFDLLDDLDDVARVHSNADFSDSLFDELD